MLTSGQFFDHVMRGAKGTKMPRGDKKQVMNFPIAFRCDESDLAVLNSVVEQMAMNDAKSARLAELCDALLPKLMSGEIDVSKVDLTQLNSHLSDHSVAIREINNSTIAETTFINRFIALRMLFEKLSHGIRHAFDILG